MSTHDSEKKNVITLLWEIENAILLTSDHDKMLITSPQFRIRTLKRRLFVLEMRPKLEVQKMKFLSIVLQLMECGFGYPIDIQWALLGSDGAPLTGGTVHNHYPVNFEVIEMHALPPYHEVFELRRAEFLKHNILTVRLRIWKTQGNLATEEFISCRSRLETMEDSILWKIPGIRSMQMCNYEDFPVQFQLTDNFVWRFGFKGTSLGDSIAVVHVLPVSTPRDWNVKFKVKLLDSRHNVVKTIEDTSRGDSNKISTLEIMSRRDLLRNTKVFLKTAVLTLICEVSVIQNTYSIRKSCFSLPNLSRDMPGFPTFLDFGTQTLDQIADSPSTSPSLPEKESIDRLSESISTTLDLGSPNDSEHSVESVESVVPPPEKDSLVEDLLNLYNSRTLSDFELRSGVVAYPVHKNILSARSEVFRTKFSSTAEESNFMDVTDLDPVTLDQMLSFMYSGKMVQQDWNTVLRLCYAAGEYQVQFLLKDCYSFLASNMSHGNVGDMLILADKHQNATLKGFLHNYILTHLAETVSTSEWATFSKDNAELASQTMREICRLKYNIQRARKIKPYKEKFNFSNFL